VKSDIRCQIVQIPAADLPLSELWDRDMVCCWVEAKSVVRYEIWGIYVGSARMREVAVTRGACPLPFFRGGSRCVRHFYLQGEERDASPPRPEAAARCVGVHRRPSRITLHFLPHEVRERLPPGAEGPAASAASGAVRVRDRCGGRRGPTPAQPGGGQHPDRLLCRERGYEALVVGSGAGGVWTRVPRSLRSPRAPTARRPRASPTAVGEAKTSQRSLSGAGT